MKKLHLITTLIAARTRLKCNEPDRALALIRQAIDLVDPDQSLEAKMRNELSREGMPPPPTERRGQPTARKENP